MKDHTSPAWSLQGRKCWYWLVDFGLVDTEVARVRGLGQKMDGVCYNPHCPVRSLVLRRLSVNWEGRNEASANQWRDRRRREGRTADHWVTGTCQKALHPSGPWRVGAAVTQRHPEVRQPEGTSAIFLLVRTCPHTSDCPPHTPKQLSEFCLVSSRPH